nr:ASN_HP1_G0038480.mRNA.1.CDS.1 [Saccharomyces cerevisiae]
MELIISILYGELSKFLYSRTFMLCGLLNVELWKYIQEAQLSSNDEPFHTKDRDISFDLAKLPWSTNY